MSALTAASSHVRCAGFGISWFAFTTVSSASPPKLVSKPQIRWLVASIESSCAEGSWSSTWLQCTVTASPGFQLRTAEPDAQHDTRGVAADHVERLVVARAPHALLAEALQEPERRERLEDRRPHGVEVDRGRHHRDDGLVGRELGRRDVVDVQRLARVLVGRRQPLEHRLLVGAHDRGPVRVGKRQCAELVGRGAVDDRGGMASISFMAGDGSRRTAVAPESGRSDLDTSSAVTIVAGPSVGRSAMPGSVIVSSARTPIGKLSGALASLAPPTSAARDQGGARAGRRGAGAGRLRDHGPGAPGRAGPDHRAPGRGQGRHPDDRARHDASTRCASRASTRSTSPTR